MTKRTRCKVDAAVDTYGIGAQGEAFDDVHEELVSLWKGETNREALGYRSLVDWFNKHLLRTVYKDNNRLTFGTQLDTEYDILTGSDEIARGELVDELELADIDAQQVRDDMVSFSTMRRHLTDCLDSEKARQEAETDWQRTSVEIATDQLLEKVQKALSSYEHEGRVAGATEAEVSIRVQLSCPHCPTRRSLEDALRHGYVCEEHHGGDS
jgi:hypothetical protein